MPHWTKSCPARNSQDGGEKATIRRQIQEAMKMWLSADKGKETQLMKFRMGQKTMTFGEGRFSRLCKGHEGENGSLQQPKRGGA